MYPFLVPLQALKVLSDSSCVQCDLPIVPLDSYACLCPTGLADLCVFVFSLFAWQIGEYWSSYFAKKRRQRGRWLLFNYYCNYCQNILTAMFKKNVLV